MAANATININSDLTVISDKHSVFKSSTDNSSAFANVFENVNKSYTEKNNETSTNDVIATTTSEKPKVDAKDNETKKAEDAHSTSNDIDTEKTITDNKNTDSTSVKDKTENSNESEDKTKTTNEESINPEKIIVSTEVEKALQSLISVDILQVEPTQLIQKNLGDNSADKTTNIQIQAQQVVSNSKIDLQKTDLKLSKITADTNTDTNTAKVTDNQAPMIKVDARAIIANNTLNVGSNQQSSQNSKDVLDKATITQDMLNKTNAKVISVETSSSNQNSNSKQNNLLNKQNPEEQIIKLSLESNTTSNNINVNVTPNFSNISDTTLQTNFAKTVDNVQTSKELSHSDILSQINSKLDNLQTENLTKVNIVLKPENLGKINLELINSKDGLIAKMTTDNQQVKEILNKNLDGLKDTLSSQGVNVNNVTVKIDETQKQSNDMFSFDNRQSNQGNQDFSGNSNKSTKGEGSFDKEINQLTETTDAKIEGTEDSISVSSYLGQVDYKI